MSALRIAGLSLRRLARDRAALFFMVALPVLVITVVGLTVRSFSMFPVGVVNGRSSAAAVELTAVLERWPSLEVHEYATSSAASTAVRRSEIAAAVVIPSSFGREIAASGPVEIEVVAERANSTQQAAATAVQAAVSQFSARVAAARFTTAQLGGDFAANLALATGLQGSVPQVRSTTVVADDSQQTLPAGFSYSAPTMLVLFVFINAVAGGATIISTRRLGMYERILAAPVGAGSVVLGEMLAAFAAALAQAALIVLVGAAAFGVSWGDPLAATLLVLVWSLVGAGAGVLAGTLFRTPQQAGALGPTIGIAFGMLGGCMWPLSIVSHAMRTVGHLTPQAWAVDAWTTLLARHGTLPDVTTKLGVLAAFAAGFLLLAAARFRRSLA